MEHRVPGSVARTVRSTLGRALGRSAEAVPEALVDAVAHGTGDRAAVGAASRECFGDRAGIDLVLFDSDEIGSYVFESSRPPVLEGASSILRRLNEEIARRYRDQTVYSGGGEGLLLAPGGEGAALCREIEDQFARATQGGLSVTTGWITVAPSDFLAVREDEADAVDGARLVSGTRAVLSRLRDVVRTRKDEKYPSRTPVRGHSQRCASCRDRAGVEDLGALREEERGEKLCVSCHQRWLEGKKNIEGRSTDDLAIWFQDSLLQQGVGAGPRARYLGFLYADGNAMGALFGRLGSLAEVGFLSAAVSEIYERLRLRVVDWVAELLPSTRPRRMPMLSFLGGGDESIWILPGALAVAAAASLPEWLDEEARRVDGLSELLAGEGCDGLSLASGLVLSDAGYPVRYQYALAKELQHHAKRRFYGAGSTSSLDFEVITDSYPLSSDLRTAREVAYGTREAGFSRTCRPYSADGFSALLESARAATAARVATTQLYALQRMADEGSAVFFNYLLYQVAREPAKARYEAWFETVGIDPGDPIQLERFFLQVPGSDNAAADARQATWIPDLLQMAPFFRLFDALREKRRAAA